ncbi:MAG: DUF4292 domain-containing protein [Planctomycetaceae bacterium]|nr:DUF4292 domain-containing protein [Planctomycetaceae bacterium]
MISTGWARKCASCCLMLICLLASSGCNIASSGYRPQWPQMLHRSTKIPTEATKEEIIAYVNQHIEPIHSWQSTSARVRVSGVPVSLNAMLAVEEPRKLRFTVSSGLSGQSEFDIGSSSEELWFFVKRMEPKAIMTVKHSELEQIQNQMPIPFQPEWLMEVLNVSTIDASEADLVRDPDNPYSVQLVSHHRNEQGQETRKIITVDLKKGEVREHQLYDSEHRLLASAKLTDYRQFPNTKARLPYDIRLEFAQQDKTMHIELKSVEINPPQLPDKLWAIPQMAGYPVRHLGSQQILGSPTAIANRKLRDKPKAITNYELDAPSGVWLQNQIIQTAQNDSAAPLTTQPVQQTDHQQLSDAIPFSAHAFTSQAPAAIPQKKTRPAPPVSSAPPFSEALPEINPREFTPPSKPKTPSSDVPEWAR